MKNTIIISFAAFFFCFSFVSALSSTSTETTEFLPDLSQPTANTEARQILERFRGLIPNTLIDTLSGSQKTAAPASAVSFSGTSDKFTKNLKIGDTDNEVLLLQKTLNEDPDTIVSVSGPGSLGNETRYFGQMTKNAVIKLQNKHYGEVLAPNGLSSGTGYFGPSTRAMLNSNYEKKNKTVTPTATESLISTIPKGPVSGLGEAVRITSLEPPHGKDGTMVTIHGTGMTTTANKIIAAGKTFYNVPSMDGKTLVFTVESPVSFNLSGMSEASSTYLKAHFSDYKTKSFPELKYPVCVINDLGMSNCAFFTIDF